MTTSDALPQCITLPPESIFPDGRFVGYWKYVRGTVETLSNQVELRFSNRMRRPVWSAFEILVDDIPVIIDYSDFHIVDAKFAAYKHWLRFHYTPAFIPFANLGSFPPWSFLDWGDYQRAVTGPQYTAQNDPIIYRFSSLENRPADLVARRTLALEILTRHCVNRLVTGWVPQHRYFSECIDSLAVVHIPGSHPHILDRTVQQMFALGVCVISPEIWTACLDDRPQAGVHYVSIRDDFSNLVEQVEWVAQNRHQAIKIGNAAKQFFSSHCTPDAIWRHIHQRISREASIATKP